MWGSQPVTGIFSDVQTAACSIMSSEIDQASVVSDMTGVFSLKFGVRVATTVVPLECHQSRRIRCYTCLRVVQLRCGRSWIVPFTYACAEHYCYHHMVQG